MNWRIIASESTTDYKLVVFEETKRWLPGERPGSSLLALALKFVGKGKNECKLEKQSVKNESEELYGRPLTLSAHFDQAERTKGPRIPM